MHREEARSRESGGVLRKASCEVSRGETSGLPVDPHSALLGQQEETAREMRSEG